MIFSFIVFHSIFCFLFFGFFLCFILSCFDWRERKQQQQFILYHTLTFPSLPFFLLVYFIRRSTTLTPHLFLACLSIHNDVLLPCPASRGLIHWLCMSYCTYSFLYSFYFAAQNNTYIIYCFCEFTFSIKSKKTHTKRVTYSPVCLDRLGKWGENKVHETMTQQYIQRSEENTPFLRRKTSFIIPPPT